MPDRLSDETSPYLLQHADNPVDWHPWGEEARERARREDRPILLSIGYSSCHWCHVMEEESFEDEETAGLMNEAFVNVKVDREERPDVDAVYMTAVQGMTGRGGWPLTVFLTPDGEPFYGGTYFPPEPRQGMPSFREVLRSVASAWKERREDVEESAHRLRRFLERSMEPAGRAPDGGSPGAELLDRAYRDLESRYDERRGGFGGAPKFPRALVLELLLREHTRTGRERALEMVVGTLDAMARGGIRDHLAGGFHRYAVDERWRVPHFEKMLYDNALLTRVYAHAWQASGEERLAEVARETGEYLLSDLRSREGGFYSARDADSEGEEGRYYVWTPEEVDSVLGPEAARLVKRHYGVTAEGNFEGRSVLHVSRDLAASGASGGEDGDEIRRRLAEARAELLEARRSRKAPFRDEKVLASWNGLALRALAEAGFALGRDDWLDAAGESAEFLLDALRPGDRLLHVWKDGEARVDAFLDDHAALGNALLSLWEVSGRGRWLDEALRLGEEAVEGFRDAESGAFYDAPAGEAGLPVRPRDDSDRATPSGTALAVELLLRLARITGEDRWRGPAEDALAGAADRAAQHPLAFGRLLSVVDLYLSPPGEVVIVGERGSEAMEGLLDVVRTRWLPNRVLAVAGSPDDREPDAGGSPLLRGRSPVDGRPTAFVCREYACREPVTEPGDLARQLDEAEGS